MGGTPSIPQVSPLSCLLKNWTKFDLSSLIIFFCNIAWPQYKLDDQEVWPANRTLINLNDTRLGLFCPQLQTWSEAPYVQALIAVSQDLDLQKQRRICLATFPQSISPTLLDDPFFSHALPWLRLPLDFPPPQEEYPLFPLPPILPSHPFPYLL